MGDISQDTGAVQVVSTAIGAQVVSITGQPVVPKKDQTPGEAAAANAVNLTTPIHDYSQLLGALYFSQSSQHVNAAKQADQGNANTQLWLSVLLGGFGNASLPGDVIAPASQVVAGVAGPFLSKVWPTDSAGTAEGQADITLAQNSAIIYIPMAQGLISSGQVAPPPGAKWFKYGVINPSNPSEYSDFVTWVNGGGLGVYAQLPSVSQSAFKAGDPNWTFPGS
jgi:hypothetical protein